MEDKLDINQEAKRIIRDHTEGFMNATQYKPDDEDELWETMLSECASILTEDFLDGKYTPMQYNDIRNEVAEILLKIFSPTSSEDKKKEMTKLSDGDITLRKRMYDIDKADHGCGYWSVCDKRLHWSDGDKQPSPCPCPTWHYSHDNFDNAVWDSLLHRQTNNAS